MSLSFKTLITMAISLLILLFLSFNFGIASTVVATIETPILISLE